MSVTKTLLALMAVAALAGCVVAPTPRYYTAAPQQPYDPYQWHTVPSEPAPAANAYPARSYSSYEPVYAAPPVYVAPPVYQPYYQPYYYEPALTFGLGVLIGNSWGRGSYGGHRHYRPRR